MLGLFLVGWLGVFCYKQRCGFPSYPMKCSVAPGAPNWCRDDISLLMNLRKESVEGTESKELPSLLLEGLLQRKDGLSGTGQDCFCYHLTPLPSSVTFPF